MIAAAIEGGIGEWKIDNPTVKAWSTHSKKDIYSFSDHNKNSYENSAIAVAFSKDGKYLASGGDKGKIYIRNIDTGKFVRTMAIQEVTAMVEIDGEMIKDVVQGGGTIQSLQFSSDGKFLVSGGYGYLPRIWDLQTGKITKEFRVKGCTKGIGPE